MPTVATALDFSNFELSFKNISVRAFCDGSTSLSFILCSNDKCLINVEVEVVTVNLTKINTSLKENFILKNHACKQNASFLSFI